nr:pentatricopeptide repeat-containing protein At4g21065-like [Ipomoea trifida]
MIQRQIDEMLFQRAKTIPHLLQLHSLNIKTGLDHHEFLLSQFVLSACSISLQFARSVFEKSPITPSLFTWNTMIREYSKSSSEIESLKLFIRLLRAGIRPDKFVFPSVLKSCGCCSMVGAGGSVHSMAIKTGFVSDVHVNNTLLKMYAACGVVEFARKVFDEMHHRDMVSWSCMIASYVDCNLPSHAILAFKKMKLANEKESSITLVSLVAACTSLLNVRLGQSIHSQILTNGIEFHVGLATSLLQMYAKCGRVEEAFQIFNSMSTKNLQSWTIMISALADNGRGEEAISLFPRMEEAGLRPDSLSFSAILSACSHLGLVEEGHKYFNRMVNLYDIRPTMEHYGCMVDLLGRPGKIEQAYEVIMSMPMEPNSVILRSFISACKQHGCSNILRLDEHLKELLLKIEPDIAANYVLAANLSSLCGYWDDADGLQSAIKEKGIKKTPGCSWVQLRSGYPENVKGDTVNCCI